MALRSGLSCAGPTCYRHRCMQTNENAATRDHHLAWRGDEGDGWGRARSSRRSPRLPTLITHTADEPPSKRAPLKRRGLRALCPSHSSVPLPGQHLDISPANSVVAAAPCVARVLPRRRRACGGAGPASSAEPAASVLCSPPGAISSAHLPPSPQYRSPPRPPHTICREGGGARRPRPDHRPPAAAAVVPGERASAHARASVSVRRPGTRIRQNGDKSTWHHQHRGGGDGVRGGGGAAAASQARRARSPQRRPR